MPSARVSFDASKRAQLIRGLLQSCETMLAIDDEFWVQWFSERGGQLHARSLIRVSSEQDALTCVAKMPADVVGGVAFYAPRDRADGSYGEIAILTMRGDVPGDCALRIRSVLTH